MSIDPQRFLEQMTLPVRQAMAAVRWLEGRVPNRPKTGQPNDSKSALSDGDCVSQEVLLTALKSLFPTVELDAEEDTPSVGAFEGNRSADTVRVDPVDGSLIYLEQSGLYAIIVGLERDERIDAALIAVPGEDLLVRAARGEGAWISIAGAPFEAAGFSEGAERVLVSHGVPEPVLQRLRAEGLEPVQAAGGAIGVSSLLANTLGALRVSRTAQGLSRRAWIASLPLLEAGGIVETPDGPLPERFCKGVPSIVVAPSRSDIERLRVLA